MGQLMRCAAITLLILFIGSTATTHNTLQPTLNPVAEKSLNEALECVPDGCDDLPPQCTIPQEHCEAALYVDEFAKTHNYSPPPGYKGGGTFRNTNGKLPPGGDYLEYRIYKTAGSPERIVIDRSTDTTWFSSDHYATFEELRRYVLM
ncbi:MAG: ribonuclease domain-containing protein [Pseudonocardia sp.]